MISSPEPMNYIQVHIHFQEHHFLTIERSSFDDFVCHTNNEFPIIRKLNVLPCSVDMYCFPVIEILNIHIDGFQFLNDCIVFYTAKKMPDPQIFDTNHKNR